MKKLIEYLEKKIELCTEMNMPLEKFAYCDCLKNTKKIFNDELIINLKIIKKEETKVVLQNKNGDTFEFNPNTKNGETLFDFLFY